jgi:hypothetical protein
MGKGAFALVPFNGFTGKGLAISRLFVYRAGWGRRRKGFGSGWGGEIGSEGAGFFGVFWERAWAWMGAVRGLKALLKSRTLTVKLFYLR